MSDRGLLPAIGSQYSPVVRSWLAIDCDVILIPLGCYCVPLTCSYTTFPMADCPNIGGTAVSDLLFESKEFIANVGQNY